MPSPERPNELPSAEELLHILCFSEVITKGCFQPYNEYRNWQCKLCGNRSMGKHNEGCHVPRVIQRIKRLEAALLRIELRAGNETAQKCSEIAREALGGQT